MSPTGLHIAYDKGTLLLKGNLHVPNAHWDARAGTYRALAFHYADIIDYLENSNLEYLDEAPDLLPMPHLVQRTELRDYQREALDSWIRAGHRGVIVLPTGAGKTLVALAAIWTLQTPTLVVVPTLDLMEQWRRALAAEFKIEIGVYGGGDNLLEPITVSTYDSAYLRVAELGNRFGFVVFDEVHHLAAAGYRQIAEMSLARARLGLTATYEREDGLHSELPRLTGGIVFELAVKDLAEEHLSGYDVEHHFVEMEPDEAEEYSRHYALFADYVSRHNVKLRKPNDFAQFIKRSSWDPEARKALLARNRALDIALNSRVKIEALKKALLERPFEKTIIFTQHNKLVYQIARTFLIPAITHTTSRDERREILDLFRSGIYRFVVTSKVLDEGVDVPDASQAIILSGTGSSREFIQRLGRILRKQEGKRARLIEIVTRNTTETKLSHRRKRKWRDSENAPQ
ncbi:MAG TPA: DEAD/DEAH box helicase family protein [Candidatus Acidoferrales bacterium]|nr:DEAD/DEAH box helicase family protein [Candidatus Acidoferrales bacterium]